MRQLIVAGGDAVLVDDEDFDWANQWKWCKGGKGYAVRFTPQKETIFLHIEIMKRHGLFVAGLEGDHKNRNLFDCQKTNLRPATRSQQVANTCKRKGTRSKYKGVVPKGRKFKAYYVHNGFRMNLGTFDSEESAATARDKAVKRIFGEFAVLNFPEELTNAEIRVS